MNELTTLRKYFEFRQSKGANVGHVLEAVDTIEAMLMAQQMQLDRQQKYREAAGKLIASILTGYYTTGHPLGLNAILRTDLDQILLEFVDNEWPRDEILQAKTVKDVLNAFERREIKVAERAEGLKIIVEHLLDRL